MEKESIYNIFDKTLYRTGTAVYQTDSLSNVVATSGVSVPSTNPSIDPGQGTSGGSTTTTTTYSGSNSAGKQGFTNDETGYILGIDAGVPKFYIGDTANYLNWTGTQLIISGNITATTGTIGGWTIGATALTSGSGANSVGLDSGGANPALYAGSATPASAPFRVSQAGALTATSAIITGTITANSGSVGSFTIGTYLYTGTKTAYNDANAGVHLGSDGIGIGNNIFTVSAAGALVATSATITGTITATSGVIGGFTLANGYMYGGIIKTAATVGAGTTGVIMDTAGLRGYDSVLGNTFNLPTDGSAPTFASGIINSTVFNVQTNAVIRTSATVGDGTANSAGILMNNTGFYACQASQLLAAANVRILVDGSGFFSGIFVIGGATATIDNVSVLQSTINTISSAGGGTVYLKSGTYTLTADISIPSSVKVEGVSRDNVIIDCNTSYKIQMIGSNAYTTGTLTIASGGTTVVGSGTTWISGMVGQFIYLGKDGDFSWYEITGRTDNTTITIGYPYTGSYDLSGDTYTIATIVKDAHLAKVTVQNATAEGVKMQYAQECNLDDIYVLSCGVGINFDQVLFPLILIGVDGCGENVNWNEVCGFEIKFSVFSNSTSGNGFTMTSCGNATFFDSGIWGNFGDGLNLTNCTTLSFISMDISSNGGQGIELVSGCNNNTFIAVNTLNNVSDGYKLTTTADNNIISSGTIIGNGGYGINIVDSTCDNNQIISPVFSGNTQENINDLGTSTTVIPLNDVQVFTNTNVFGGSTTEFLITDNGTAQAKNDDSVYSTSTVWATVHGAATGTLRGGTTSQCNCSLSGTTYTIERAFFNFDTSRLGASATIVSATFNVRGTAKSGTNTSTYNLYASTGGDPTVAADYNNNGTTAFSDSAITQAGFNNAGFNTWTLNATGRAAINKTGVTQIALCEASYDIANTAPTTNSATSITFANQTNATKGNLPYLTVVVSTPTGTYRYTWDGTGTDPTISLANVPVGSNLLIAGQNFNAANNGTFKVTAAAANYFEVYNVSGVSEFAKTLGTGAINFAWLKPAGTKSVQVICVGGGGGGGGGKGAAVNNLRDGASGGGGGSIASKVMRASNLGSSVKIIVGASATGGAGGSSANGGTGTNGNTSSFGTYLNAYGGGGGKWVNGNGDMAGGSGGGSAGAGLVSAASTTLGGSPASTAGVDGISGQGAGGSISSDGKCAEYGGASGGGNKSSPLAQYNGGSSLYAAGGGGCSGYVTNANPGTEVAGMAGGVSGAYTPSGGGTLGAVHTAGGAGTSRSGYGCGDGGGGGGGTNNGTGGAGGDGGVPGGGGGGGAGGTSVGGNGGAGGRGEVIVISS